MQRLRCNAEYCARKNAERRARVLRTGDSSAAWAKGMDEFVGKKCVKCGKTLSYRTVKYRLCKSCWVHVVHPMLMRLKHEEAKEKWKALSK
jgi:hypothetical protein